MDIEKSSRHQKIIGNFGENLICNWLSRSGFEVTIVDHTGIDVVAYHPEMKLRIGISVKSRTRREGTEKSSVNLFKTYLGNDDKSDRKKVSDACEAFGCEPWIGVYVETGLGADLYLTSLKNYDEKYQNEKEFSGSQRSYVEDWKMTENYTERYAKDLEVKYIGIKFAKDKWNW